MISRKNIFSRFMKREVVSNVTVENVKDKSNYIPLKDMTIGFNTMLLLRRLFNEGDILIKLSQTNFF